jgi:hypothetical protein
MISSKYDSSSEPPIVFESSLTALEGNLKLLRTIAQMLLHQIEVDLPAIHADVSCMNSRALTFSSHRLKGSLGAIAALPAYRACVALNKSAQSGEVTAYQSEFSHLEHEVARLQPYLHAWLTDQSERLS